MHKMPSERQGMTWLSIELLLQGFHNAIVTPAMCLPHQGMRRRVLTWLMLASSRCCHRVYFSCNCRITSSRPAGPGVSAPPPTEPTASVVAMALEPIDAAVSMLPATEPALEGGPAADNVYTSQNPVPTTH
jgi:hypothetical protein